MRLSQSGLNLIKSYEGLSLEAYKDSGGVLTIGYGHTNVHTPKFTSTDVWTETKCNQVLASDMKIFEDRVTSLAKVTLTQNEFDALVSWSFNTGGPSTATLWKKLNAGDKQGAADQLLLWDHVGTTKVKGLTNRRIAERNMFLSKSTTAPASGTAAGTVVVGTAVATQSPDYWPYILVGTAVVALVSWLLVHWYNKRKEAEEAASIKTSLSKDTPTNV